jgi:transcriptional regulator with XRE-family HTH domain
MTKEQKPRYRRLDLINWMPVGEQKRIARRLGISRGYVSSVLNGKRNQDNDNGINIIRLAEQAVAKERCKQVRR